MTSFWKADLNAQIFSRSENCPEGQAITAVAVDGEGQGIGPLLFDEQFPDLGIEQIGRLGGQYTYASPCNYITEPVLVVVHPKIPYHNC